MIRRMLTDLYAANLAYAHRLTDGLDDAASVAMPAEGMNHPRWIIGHLGGTADHMAAMHFFGLEKTQPAAWREVFGPVSQPVADASVYPPLVELLALLDERHAAVSAAVLAATPDFFERTCPATLPEGFRQRFPTVGNALLHIMIGHESMHLGQLSAWRRVRGLPSV